MRNIWEIIKRIIREDALDDLLNAPPSEHSERKRKPFKVKNKKLKDTYKEFGFIPPLEKVKKLRNHADRWETVRQKGISEAMSDDDTYTPPEEPGIRQVAGYNKKPRKRKAAAASLIWNERFVNNGGKFYDVKNKNKRK